MRVLDVGCGPGATPTSWPGGGSSVHGIDISRRFVELAAATAPDGATFERLDARSMAFDGRVRCRDLPVPGRVRADDRRRRRRARGRRHRRALRPGGRLALSAFNAYFAVKYHEDGDVRRRPPASATSAPRCATRPGEATEVDLWTGCYTPRELRLLLDRAGLTRRRHQQRRAGRYGDAPPTHRVARIPGDRHATLTLLTGRAGELPVDLAILDESRFVRTAFLSIPTSKAAVPLSDTTTTSSASATMGTFDEEGNYTPREIVADDLGMSFADAIDGTMVEVEDGQLVNGTVVKIDKDEVLLDIGYKSEGVIPARELSIRNDVNPHEIVSLGEKIEALVLQKEDKEGRLLLSQEAGAVRAGVGHDREDQGSRRHRRGSGDRGRQGRPHRRHRPARLPARHRSSSCAVCATSPRTSARPCRRRSSSSTRTATTSCSAVAPSSKRRRRRAATASSPTSSRARSARARCRSVVSASVRSSTSAAWTASSTSASCRGSTSTTRARSSPSAIRSPCRCSTSTSSASASACR